MTKIISVPIDLFKFFVFNQLLQNTFIGYKSCTYMCMIFTYYVNYFYSGLLQLSTIFTCYETVNNFIILIIYYYLYNIFY